MGPRPAKGHMPFPGHRSCDEWMGLEWYPVQCLTDEHRKRDAVNGSEKLKRKIAAAR
jgi:hypothetical protein